MVSGNITMTMNGNSTWISYDDLYNGRLNNALYRLNFTDSIEISF